MTGRGVASNQSRWVATAPYYLFPARALSRKFRSKYLAGLQALFTAGQLVFHGRLQETSPPAQFAVFLRQAAELEKLKGALGGLNPSWFIYECGLKG